MWATPLAIAQTRYATSDSEKGYVHWIDLYDEDNNRIDPAAEQPKPYSPEKTCGRCHDFATISHGWHFNAVDGLESGRVGQPWVWSDPRTGTHLPLSYRDWLGTHNPDDLGLTRWQVAAKFGGYLPGGGPGSAEAMSQSVNVIQGLEQTDRAQVTGPLPVDCMLCHHRPGSGYSPFAWTEQIEDQNFAYAPAVALGIATVSANMRRLKDDFDRKLAENADKLPAVKYELSRFRTDSKVYFDLIRKPDSDACEYCHTNTAASSINDSRWEHDQDVHLRAGLQCADCHRNGLDHKTVRGYDFEKRDEADGAESLTCAGCHSEGRLGSPFPEHRGLPPLHFERMTCTACHSGAAPVENAERQLNSIVHQLGKHTKRTGEELPGIVGPVILPLAGDETEATEKDEDRLRLAPHRMLWPSFWATRQGEETRVLNPELAFEILKSKLKVRRDFVEELSEVKLSLSERKELLGEERARAKEEDRTEEEQRIIAEAEAKARTVQIQERMTAGLSAIEEQFPGTEAVFVSGGVGFVQKDGQLSQLAAEELGGLADAYAWPMAHNVRPARQALGATGCTECHSSGALFFNTEVTPVAVLPGQAANSQPVSALQGVDVERLQSWNELFQGRAIFKILGLIALGGVGLVTISAAAWNIGRFWRT